MDPINKTILNLLSTDIFKKLLSSDTLQITQLNAVVALLIKTGIPFDLEFSPGTRRAASAAQLTIYINSSTTLSFTISFEGGQTVFGIDS